MDLIYVSLFLLASTVVFLTWVVDRWKRRARMYEEALAKVRLVFGNPAFYQDFKVASENVSRFLSQIDSANAGAIQEGLKGVIPAIPLLVREANPSEFGRIKEELHSVCSKNSLHPVEVLLALSATTTEVFSSLVELSEAREE
jgi:hypothetical protein